MGDSREYNLQWSCTSTGNWRVKGPHSERNYFMCGAPKSLRHVCQENNWASRSLSLCSSCSFSLPSMKVVDKADPGHNSEEQKLGRNALTSFTGDCSTLFYCCFCHFTHFCPLSTPFPT